MKKKQISEMLREHAKSQASPTPEDRNFVSRVYSSVCDVIGAANSLQIGSYPRFTAIRPLHDLDVLYILGDWDPEEHDPSNELNKLKERLENEFHNPTTYSVVVQLQTHSVTIKFLDNEAEAFAVDVVPAFKDGKNDMEEDCYVVPEIARASHTERRRISAQVRNGAREMAWLRSDPRGYISVASKLNQANADFRKAVKITKSWRAICKANDPDFPLKSFHLEQAITRWTRNHPQSDIFDMVFAFFCELPDLIRYPQIPDRAEPTRNIDEYVADLPETDRRKVIEARDGFLIALEYISEKTGISSLLASPKRRRASATEAYLFDQRIPVFIEHEFSIIAKALERPGGFRAFLLDLNGKIGTDRNLQFRLDQDAPSADVYKWRVKNDDNTRHPRGEITDHRTMHDPEHTRFKGKHKVECFAIRNGICIGRATQNVVLDSVWDGPQ